MPSDKLLLFHKQRRVTTSFDISASDAQPVRAMATRVSSARISNNLSTPRSPSTASAKNSGFPTPTAVAPCVWNNIIKANGYETPRDARERGP